MTLYQYGHHINIAARVRFAPCAAALQAQKTHPAAKLGLHLPFKRPYPAFHVHIRHA